MNCQHYFKDALGIFKKLLSFLKIHKPHIGWQTNGRLVPTKLDFSSFPISLLFGAGVKRETLRGQGVLCHDILIRPLIETLSRAGLDNFKFEWRESDIRVRFSFTKETRVFKEVKSFCVYDNPVTAHCTHAEVIHLNSLVPRICHLPTPWSDPGNEVAKSNPRSSESLKLWKETQEVPRYYKLSRDVKHIYWKLPVN